MQTIPVQFKFKGHRDYIHGTDMYNLMINQMAGAKKEIRFSVHDFMRKPAGLLYISESKHAISDIEHGLARCQYMCDGRLHYLVLTEDNAQKILPERYAYDESRITDLCSMHDNSITIDAPSPFSFIETVVAMNKRLHEHLFKEAEGKWIFTRLDLQANHEAQQALAVHLVHNMHYRLTKSDILHQGVKIGDIYFSLVKS